MVKFGRKFFFNTKHSKNSKLWSIIIKTIIAIVILFLLAFIIYLIRKPKPAPVKKVVVREKIKNELNSVLPEKTAYFKNLDNFDIDDIEVNYPDYLPLEENYDECTEEELKVIEEIKGGKDKSEFDDPYACVRYATSTIGSYDVKVTYKGKNYTVVLDVVDKKAPTLVTKKHEITEGQTYKITDFIESCVDNSKKDCTFEYYYDKDKKIDVEYDKLTKVGSYDVEIVAIDDSGNKSVPSSATLVIKEKPQLKTFTVEFNSNGGSNVDNQTVVENEKVTAPKNPTRDGYTFTGWYVNGKVFDFNTPITSNMSLTAGWSKNQPPATTCSTGDLTYNSSKYPIVAVFVTNGNCPLSKSELNLATYGNKATTMVNREMARLKKWQDANGFDYYYVVIGGGPQGVLNNSGKGYVGYTIEVSIAKKVGNSYSELARYFLDTNGKRNFSLNLISMPES